MFVDAMRRNLLRLLGRVDANAIAAWTAQQPIDGYAPQFAGNVPQGHVNRRQRVDQERPAADVAMGSKQLLPEIFDAGWVLAIKQLKQRMSQQRGNFRIEPGRLAPAGDSLIGFDLHEQMTPHGGRLEVRDLDVRG